VPVFDHGRLVHLALPLMQSWKYARCAVAETAVPYRVNGYSFIIISRHSLARLVLMAACVGAAPSMAAAMAAIMIHVFMNASRTGALGQSLMPLVDDNRRRNRLRWKTAPSRVAIAVRRTASLGSAYGRPMGGVSGAVTS
jgi:hypothetical protein